MTVQAAVPRRSGESQTIEDRFHSLVEQWKKDTLVLSNPTALEQHPAYRAIIRMGSDAIPLILKELAREQDFWFGALQELTGANPETSDQRGKIHFLTRAWLDWGREHGYEC